MVIAMEDFSMMPNLLDPVCLFIIGVFILFLILGIIGIIRRKKVVKTSIPIFERQAKKRGGQTTGSFSSADSKYLMGFPHKVFNVMVKPKFDDSGVETVAYVLDINLGLFFKLKRGPLERDISMKLGIDQLTEHGLKEFDEKFDIHTDNPVKAKIIFTSELQNDMLKLDKVFKWPRLKIRDNLISLKIHQSIESDDEMDLFINTFLKIIDELYQIWQEKMLKQS